jgi:hypothetical protein
MESACGIVSRVALCITVKICLSAQLYTREQLSIVVNPFMLVIALEMN